MKPTSEDFEPRRDGWFEHRGTWEEVVIGTVLADTQGRRSLRWEVIDMAHGDQVAYGMTLWMKIREQTSGEEFPVRPHQKTHGVKILTRDPRDVKVEAATGTPGDSEAIMLLVRELEAEVLARHDTETGEVVCPDYLYRSHEEFYPGHLLKGMIEHMRFAHGLSVNDDMELAPAITLHGQAHAPKHKHIGKGGFPHRHVPEDLSKM